MNLKGISKKVILSIACLAFLIYMFCACQVQTEQNYEFSKQASSTPANKSDTNSPTTKTAPESLQDLTNNSETTKKTINSEWKTAYLNFLDNKKDSHISYALVYIDDDNIPELYLSGVGEAVGDGICSYKNGKVIEQRLNRIGGGKYIEKSGTIIIQNGNMGHCYTHIYKLSNEGFSLTFTALSVEHIEPLENNEYNIYYEYSIGNKEVSEKKHNDAINAAFDFENSIELDKNTVDYESIKQQIIDYE